MKSDFERVSREFYSSIAESIKEYGFHIIGVTDAKVPFLYTIGLTSHNLPELIIFGSVKRPALNIISTTAHSVIETNRPFEDGELFSPMGEDRKVKIVDLVDSVLQDYTIQVGRFYGKDFNEYVVQEIRVPDKNGFYVGDENVDPLFTEFLPDLRKVKLNS